MNNYDLITILGPTACGKTSFAANLAYHLDAEIISADSRQVYRRMDIGTGKDLSEYTVQGKQIPYHLIDIVEPGYKYNVYEYQRDFLTAYEAIRSRGKRIILCGGTGLYLESILRGYRLSTVPQNLALRQALESKSLAELTTILRSYKALHNTTDVDTAQRAIRAIEIEEHYRQHTGAERPFPTLHCLTLGLSIEREARRKRITKRLKQRLSAGMIEEVQALLASGISPEDLIYYGLEYKYVTQHLQGKLSKEELFHVLEIAIHQFAKRQMTWLRGMERRGITIHWFPTPDHFLTAAETEQLFNQYK
ncbi:tRNA (adenosine(37)-N6)-dimethylallyltransferase MiaA [Alloprevotella tannerae]|uniref:tRNA (adenosine(37)-N6)-dimethylallyltransferase MiaA n=1 Tax=Alloprevotella tannerae TaxID=76122 RepID=UPI0028F135DF|nr:tRNA (adenosine(37)-N6)-dimethylallyltransferase MiaA [Alloprevotella tannerae]